MLLNIMVPIGLCLLIPLLLFVGGKLNIKPGLRFKATAILTLLIWCVVCILLTDGSTMQNLLVWLAGTMCITSVILVSFMFWSVLCWGYTISMLLCLANNNGACTISEWEKLYAGDGGIRELTVNRSSVLVALGFAFSEENNLVLTKRGLLNSVIIKKGSQLLGVVQ